MEASQTDVLLDLVQILEEALESGRLFGGDNITIEEVRVDARTSTITLALSTHETVDVRVRLRD